jgi:hypothetical protein
MMKKQEQKKVRSLIATIRAKHMESSFVNENNITTPEKSLPKHFKLKNVRYCVLS